MKKLFSLTATLLILALALALGQGLWKHYMDTPWTRDGRVRADIINVAPDVAGQVVDVAVGDNQQVKKGDLLMQIDPEHYELLVKQARAEVAARKAALKLPASHWALAAQADYQQALARLQTAELNLARTRVTAPVDGYVTNLNVHRGDYAHAGEAKVALIDMNSFWVYGFFEETKLPQVNVGDRAEMEMMNGQRLTGHVDSIARGIYDRDNPQSRELLADVNPTFNWVRLAQRVPVRIHLDPLPDGFLLAAGMTCTVILKPAGQRLAQPAR